MPSKQPRKRKRKVKLGRVRVISSMSSQFVVKCEYADDEGHGDAVAFDRIPIFPIIYMGSALPKTCVIPLTTRLKSAPIPGSKGARMEKARGYSKRYRLRKRLVSLAKEAIGLDMHVYLVVSRMTAEKVHEFNAVISPSFSDPVVDDEAVLSRMKIMKSKGRARRKLLRSDMKSTKKKHTIRRQITSHRIDDDDEDMDAFDDGIDDDDE